MPTVEYLLHSSIWGRWLKWTPLLQFCMSHHCVRLASGGAFKGKPRLLVQYGRTEERTRLILAHALGWTHIHDTDDLSTEEDSADSESMFAGETSDGISSDTD